jgi:hypothetical protein
MNRRRQVLWVIVGIVVIGLLLYRSFDLAISLDYARQDERIQKAQIDLLRGLLRGTGTNLTRAQVESLVETHQKDHIIKRRTDRVEIEGVVFRFEGDSVAAVTFGEDDSATGGVSSVHSMAGDDTRPQERLVNLSKPTIANHRPESVTLRVTNQSSGEIVINVAVEMLDGRWWEVVASTGDPEATHPKTVRYETLKPAASKNVSFAPAAVIRRLRSHSQNSHAGPVRLRLRVDVRYPGSGADVQSVPSEPFDVSADR